MNRVLDGQIVPDALDDIRAYDGVRTKRVIACIMDYIIVGLLLFPSAIIVALVGLFTLGLGWSLFAILCPLTAIIYVWKTLGGSKQATLGMQIMGVKLHRLDGRPVDGLTAIVHTVLFWVGNVALTPLVLLVTLFSDRKRTLHDIVLGTVVMRDY